jgi:peptidyl-prolyl cis-trans isomerase A (cyclophilin A)
MAREKGPRTATKQGVATARFSVMLGAMLTTLISALALGFAAPASTVPPQTTQLPPAPAPITAPATPVVEVDTRPYVALVTDLGTITVRLEDKRAPITAGNFLRYVDSKRMDGFSFYRSTRSWGPANQLIQAGNRGDGNKNYPPIAHEPTRTTGLTNCKGALVMARLNPGDATTDFFLLLSDIKGFDSDAPGGDGPGFAVFGELVGGADVVEKIFNAPISPTAGEGVLVGQMLDPMVTIKTARRVPAPADAPAGCVVKAP